MKSVYTGFLFGNYPELSFLELKSVLSRHLLAVSPKLITSHLAVISPDPAVFPIISDLGGTVKIGEVFSVNSSNLPKLIFDDLTQNNKSKACFHSSVSSLSSRELAQSVKQIFKEKLIPLHFRLPPNVYASAGVGESWSDYLLFEIDSQQFLFITKSVQDINHWSFKDYSRPHTYPHKGMLPPKISRMLINLGLGDRLPAQSNLYDPFCGSGTILLEALDLGVSQVIASDVSKDQVNASSENCSWFLKTKPNQLSVHCFTKDIMAIKPSDLPNQLDMIVFEGYLGPPEINQAKIPGLVKGLTKMYHGVFKRLKPLLKPQGRLVCALPAFFAVNGNITTLKPLIDTCEKLGYTFLVPPLIVGRPKALVKREIYILAIK